MFVPQADWKHGPKVVRPSMQANLKHDIDSAVNDVLDAAGYHMRYEGLIEIIPSFMDNKRITVVKLNREFAVHCRTVGHTVDTLGSRVSFTQVTRCGTEE